MPGPAGGTPAGQMMRQTPLPRTQTPLTHARPDPEAVDYTPTPTPRPTGPAYDPTEDYSLAGESTIRPHLSFQGQVATPGGPGKHRVDWLLWGGVLVVAMATTAAAAFLLPRYFSF